MDDQTRNEFEQFCALAEIEEDPEGGAEIKSNIVRLLDEKEAGLNRKRSGSGVSFPGAPSDVA